MWTYVDVESETHMFMYVWTRETPSHHWDALTPQRPTTLQNGLHASDPANRSTVTLLALKSEM